MIEPQRRGDAEENLLRIFLAVAAACGLASGAELVGYPEYVRPDPFGGVVAPDRAAGVVPWKTVKLGAARGGYVSFHLVAKADGEYTVSLAPKGPVQVDVFREWFHLTETDKSYYPDALVPVALPYRAKLPDPENRVSGQTAQAFWVDVWVPADAAPGVCRMEARLDAGKTAARLPVEIRVLPARIPAEDVVAIDHNSYGSSYIGAPYLSDEFFRGIHAYHRLFYEHRGVFHQLGYGHAGKVGREFAPALEGSGRKRHVSDWSLYDKHYGPLLDGSAFASTRRGARPVQFVYLPINPEWPASLVWWGEPGYEAEFRNVVSEMERHFREKGWTRTVLEVFFNHKKRYKGFEWDGDETRFAEDLPYFHEYSRMLKAALPAGTPVQFRMRADVSWSTERQFKDLAGVVTMWVAGGSELSWIPDQVKAVKARGDIVWSYGGTPEVTKPLAQMAFSPLRAWIWGVDGYVHWLSTGPGRDPWFRFDGGGTALAYPGGRFGIKGPLASIRLKIERNCQQDLALLESVRGARRDDSVQAAAVRLFNGTKLEDWWMKRPAFADRPPEELSNADYGEASTNEERLRRIEPGSWDRVHQFALKLASEAK